MICSFSSRIGVPPPAVLLLSFCNLWSSLSDYLLSTVWVVEGNWDWDLVFGCFWDTEEGPRWSPEILRSILAVSGWIPSLLPTLNINRQTMLHFPCKRPFLKSSSSQSHSPFWPPGGASLRMRGSRDSQDRLLELQLQGGIMLVGRFLNICFKGI